MASKKKRSTPASPSRQHMAGDISWVTVYRSLMIGLITLVIGMVGWQSNRIISSQDQLSDQVTEIQIDIARAQATVMGLTEAVGKNTASIHDGEKRLNRTNDRQVEMGKDIAVIQSQVMELQSGAK